MSAIITLIGKICVSIFWNCENGDDFQGGWRHLRSTVYFRYWNSTRAGKPVAIFLFKIRYMRMIYQKYVPILAVDLNIRSFRTLLFICEAIWSTTEFAEYISVANECDEWVIMKTRTGAITQRLCTVTFYLHTEKNASILVLSPSLEQN